MSDQDIYQVPGDRGFFIVVVTSLILQPCRWTVRRSGRFDVSVGCERIRFSARGDATSATLE
jgi:hypothetical protein